jgi:lysophospholipase L1-like esterase
MQQFHVHVRARHLITCALLIALSSVALMGLASHPQKTHAAATVNIMPLGDSITGSPGCWRALLWNQLLNTGYTNINFVGTLNNSTACGIPFDGDNEGHGGYLATNIANQNLLPGWLAATNPNIVMMHLGTNDVWNNIPPATILAAYSTLVNQMRANNPNMRILVAQITPMDPSGCSTCAQGVINLNAAIPAWASSKSTAQSPIIVVDQWTGYNDSTDTIDGVHPNASGNAKIAAKWYPPLTAQINSFNGSGGTTPTPTPTSGSKSYAAASSVNTLAGGAVVEACSVCSGGSKVGYVGLGGTLQFNTVQATSAGTDSMTIDYIDGDAGRTAQMSVNGGTPTTITFHGTNDSNWNFVQSLSVSVPLNAGTNTILFSNPSGPAPDFDQITVTPIGGGSTPTPTPTMAPTPTPTPTHTPTPTATPTSGSSCKVSYVIQNQWAGGFTNSTTITNTGSSAISSWTLKFTFPGSQQVTEGWDGTFSQSGSQVTVTNMSYNGSIASGASLSLGFNGSWTTSNPNPTAFTLNGATCSTS